MYSASDEVSDHIGFTHQHGVSSVLKYPLDSCSDVPQAD